MKTKHLSTETHLSYIYRTLDDAARESIDAHLVNCPECRAELEEHQRARTRIAREVEAALNSETPSSRMNFAGIADRVTSPGSWWERFQGLASAAPVAVSIAGLVLAVLGMWLYRWGNPVSLDNPQPATFRTLACFLFVLASVQEFNMDTTFRPRNLALSLVAGILWLGSAIIGLLNIIVIRDLTIMLVLAAGGTRADATVVTTFSVIISVLLYIGVVIGGADYHFKHLGQVRSWKFFSLTLLGQLFLLILPYILAPYLMS